MGVVNIPPPTESRRSTGRRTSDAFLRRALEIAHLGWWQLEIKSATDSDQNVLTWSDEVFRIFGHDPRSFEPTVARFFAQVHPDDVAAAREVERRAIADGADCVFEHRVVRSDGSVRLVEERGTVERDADGKPVRMVGTITDITDRRRIEDALGSLGSATGLLSQIVEHSHDAIVSFALDGVITTWNPAAERVFGYRAAEVIGRDARLLVPPDLEHELVDCLEYAKKGQLRAPYETVRLHRDGSQVNVEIASSPIRDHASGTVIGASAIVRDVTQQRRIAAQLQHAQRLESIGRLAGGVAHDFNNLLMAITGYAELLRMDLPSDAPAQDDLRAILSSAERGARLTRQLLAFGRRQVLHAVQLDLNAVLTEMEGVLRPLAGSDVTLSLDLSSTPAFVRADRAQIEQAIVNVVANARDAMPHGGVLGISTAIVEMGREGPAHRPTIEAGRYVRVAVSDTGIGMDADVQSRLFEPFFTTKPRGTSTGMGLATTYGIVKQSGGFITVESVPGQGTTVRAFLPFAATPVDAQAPAATPAETGETAPGGDETILIVEDDAAVRASSKATLGRLGYTVLDAATPSEALDVLSRRSGDVDVLITDILLPEMSGVQLGEIVQSRYPHVRIIRMSGYSGDEPPAGPPTAYLQKPFSVVTLARAIRGAIAGSV